MSDKCKTVTMYVTSKSYPEHIQEEIFFAVQDIEWQRNHIVVYRANGTFIAIKADRVLEMNGFFEESE